jgi:hypothetical protein
MESIKESMNGCRIEGPDCDFDMSGHARCASYRL